jgi:secondary thiamine-phosphate synthase enzyme
MNWWQTTITLSAKKRGCHLVTKEILKQVPKISQYSIGLAHFFLQHSSASLIINENADPDVQLDMEDALNRLIPESASYRHNTEGSDDMPAHIKTGLLGVSVTVPITDGRLNLGTWQGLWLCEHRDNGGRRSIVVTLQGELKKEYQSTNTNQETNNK